jgi:hypothetical protein
MRNLDLITTDESRRAAGILLAEWGQTIPGLMTNLAAVRVGGQDGYSCYLLRASLRELTQGEG